MVNGSQDMSVQLKDAEIGKILALRSTLEQGKALIQAACRYLQLNWRLLVMDSEGLTDLEIDFGQDRAVWSQHLLDLMLVRGQVRLGLKTGSPSRLLVLKVDRENHGQTWEGMDCQSSCLAQAGKEGEYHYFSLPPCCPPPGSGCLLTPPVTVFGEDGLVLAPSSLDAQAEGEDICWLSPPGESAPPPPAPLPVWNLLQEGGLIHPDSWFQADLPIPSWEELYPFVVAHDSVMKALLTPSPSLEGYYQAIFRAAVAAGLKEGAIVRGLFWHAPLGAAHSHPNRGQYLEEMLAMVQSRSGEEENQAQADVVGMGRCRPDQKSQIEQETSLFAAMLGFVQDQLSVDKKRHEAIMVELEQISSRTATLETKMTFLERHFKGGLDPDKTSEQMADIARGLSCGSDGDFSEQIQRAIFVRGISTVLQKFLRNNPDLADDQDKVRMLLFCLKDYVDIDPTFSNLPLNTRLGEAAKFARNFLKEIIGKSLE